MDAGPIGAGVTDVRILEQTSKISELKRAERAAKAKTTNMAEVDKAAEEFESVFLSQMLQHMFNGVDINPMGEGGNGDEIYKSMLIDEYAKLMSRTGGIGVASHVKREMLALQEVSHEAK